MNITNVLSPLDNVTWVVCVRLISLMACLRISSSGRSFSKLKQLTFFLLSTLCRLLRGRLGMVQMLASLTIFNLAHADKCVDFLLSENDKKQWQVHKHLLSWLTPKLIWYIKLCNMFAIVILIWGPLHGRQKQYFFSSIKGKYAMTSYYI